MIRARSILAAMILLSGFCGTLKSQDDIPLNWDYSGLSFSQLAAKVDSIHKIRIFYKDEWVRDLAPGTVSGAGTLRVLLDRLFEGSSLFYFTDKTGNIVITRDFAVRRDYSKIRKEEKYLPPTDYFDDQDRKTTGNLPVDIGNPSDRNKPGNVMISGYVTDRDTREPVAGATIYNPRLMSGTVTNEFGYYSIQMQRGTWLLQFSFIGMKERQININLYGPGELNVEMNSVLIPLKETVISAQKSLLLQSYETGVERVNMTSFRLLPASMGESDIIKSMLLIPGIQSMGEGSSGFNVRGGSSDQNLILLYGAPVYNSSHFFGFFSAVNSDIIKDVTLYKGGMPSKFGGRASSVLDIGTMEGNRQEFRGNAGISPVTTHVMIEGPLIKDKLTYIACGRTTYSNWILDAVDNRMLNNSRASFMDFNGKLTWDYGKNDKLDLSGYLSNDAFRFYSDTLYSYRNSIVSLRWRHFFNSRFFSTVSVNNSSYSYNVSGMKPADEAFKLSHRINSTGLKADFNWYEGRNEVNYGIEMIRYAVMPGSYYPAGDSSLIVQNIIEKERALEGALYLEDKFVLTDYLSVNAGLRLSSWFAFGPNTFLEYDPEYSRRSSTVTDTLQFNSLYRTYLGPEFRVSVNFRTSQKSSFKLNYNRTRQNLHLLSNTTSISPTDTWKLSDYYFKPQIGDQFSAGFYRMFSGNRIEGSAEAYFKTIRNMVEFKSGTDLVMNDNIETDLVNVRGRAYGVELLMKKNAGRVRWSLGYTYSRTFLQSTGRFSDESINGGEWFPADYDKPHDLIATFNYLFSRRFSFSSNFTYSTGRPVTYPVSSYHLGDLLLTQYSKRNEYRIPDYMRLDISLRFSGNLKSKKIAHPHWIFSVYNLLGRKNVYSVYFRSENERIAGYKLSVFGRAIPSLSFNFDF